MGNYGIRIRISIEPGIRNSSCVGTVHHTPPE